MNKKIKALRKAFAISNAAFMIVGEVNSMYGCQPEVKLCLMKEYNDLALNEINKDNPDMTIINQILVDMELITSPVDKN